jgi:pyruvate dehydrogenase E2 component (dihydrolipoamide acetyltransferase)
MAAVGVVMPKAGISVESCIIGTWRKKVGETVAVGEILFDYETDKASFECESTAGGTLLELFYEGGDEVPCLEVVCAVGAVGDDTSALKKAPSAVAAMSGVVAAAPVAAAVVATVEKNGAVSPRARNMAERMKVDLGGVTASGPRGRVIERDVVNAEINKKPEAGDRIGIKTETMAAEYIDEKISQIRKVISRSMTKSLTEMAQLTNHHSCDATGVLRLRKRYKDGGATMGLDGVSVGDLVLYAVVRALLKHPDMNAHLINGETLRRFGGVHLGVAVDTPRGLMVPTVFDADKLSLLGLSKKVKELAGAAKAGSISPDLLQGASFTVSNLGALGVEMFTPVINPPQVGILGVCGTTPRVRDGGGGIQVYQSMGLSVTYDHRVIDGAPASRFALDVAANIENIDLVLAL